MKSRYLRFSFISSQPELLAALFADECAKGASPSTGQHGGESCANNDLQQQPPTFAEGFSLVGGSQFQMEPTKELNEEVSPPPLPPNLPKNDLAMDTDFCDSLLNSVPSSASVKETVTSQALHSEAVSLYDCHSLLIPDFDSLDTDCLDLECFLSDPDPTPSSVPLTC